MARMFIIKRGLEQILRVAKESFFYVRHGLIQINCAVIAPCSL